MNQDPKWQALFEIVQNVVVDQLNVDIDDVAPSATLFDDLGADSLDIVELVMAAEETFGISIPDTEAERMTTIQRIVDYVYRQETELPN